MSDKSPRTHTALVVICITFLAFTATVTGSYLLWKGFAGGGELVMTLNTAISGLIGFLGGRISNVQPALNKSEVVVKNAPDDPIPVEDKS